MRFAPAATICSLAPTIFHFTWSPESLISGKNASGIKSPFGCPDRHAPAWHPDPARRLKSPQPHSYQLLLTQGTGIPLPPFREMEIRVVTRPSTPSPQK